MSISCDLIRPCSVRLELLDPLIISSMLKPEVKSDDPQKVDVILLPNNKIKIKRTDATLISENEKFDSEVKMEITDTKDDSNGVLQDCDNLYSLLDNCKQPHVSPLSRITDDCLSNYEIKDMLSPGHMIQSDDLLVIPNSEFRQRGNTIIQQYQSLLERKGRTFICDEQGNRIVSTKLDRSSAEKLLNAIRSNQGSLFLENCKRGEVDAFALKVVFDTQQEFLDLHTEGIISKHSFKQCPELYSSFLELLYVERRYEIQDDYAKYLHCHINDYKSLDRPFEIYYECTVVNCSVTNSSRDEAIKHAKRHAELDPFDFVCDHCGKRFIGVGNMKRHLRIHLGNNGKGYKCAHCEYKGATPTHVKRHMAHKHFQKSIPCPYCPFMAATNTDLRVHLARRHWDIEGTQSLNNLPKTYRRNWTCDKCDAVFHDYSEFQNHIYAHSSQTNKYQCNLCPYNCKSFSKLKRHMLYHQGQRNFECAQCKQRFYQMEHLKRHLSSIHRVKVPQIGRGHRLGADEMKKIMNGSTKQTDETIDEDCTDANLIQLLSDLQQTLFEPKTEPVTSKSATFPPAEVPYTEPFSETKSEPNSLNLSNIFNTANPIVDYTQSLTESLNLNNLFSPLDHLQQNSMSVYVPPPDYSTEDFSLYPSQIPSSQCFKIVSKCIYSCRHCQYTTTNLYRLNEHSKIQHMDLVDFTQFICTFCNRVTEKKSDLKAHLQRNHLNRVPAPVLLSSDVILTGSSTRFQCGICRLYRNSFQDLTNHITLKHKLDVVIIDSEQDETVRYQLQTRGRAELVCTVKNDEQVNSFNEPLFFGRLTSIIQVEFNPSGMTVAHSEEGIDEYPDIEVSSVVSEDSRVAEDVTNELSSRFKNSGTEQDELVNELMLSAAEIRLNNQLTGQHTFNEQMILDSPFDSHL